MTATRNRNADKRPYFLDAFDWAPPILIMLFILKDRYSHKLIFQYLTIYLKLPATRLSSKGNLIHSLNYRYYQNIVRWIRFCCFYNFFHVNLFVILCTYLFDFR